MGRVHIFLYFENSLDHRELKKLRFSTTVPEQLTQLESSVSPSSVPYLPGGQL